MWHKTTCVIIIMTIIATLSQQYHNVIPNNVIPTFPPLPTHASPVCFPTITASVCMISCREPRSSPNTHTQTHTQPAVSWSLLNLFRMRPNGVESKNVYVVCVCARAHM